MHIPLPQHLKAATGSVIVVFWFFSIIFTAVQISTLSSLMNVESRAGTEYLNSDQIVDTAVIIALVSNPMHQVLRMKSSRPFIPHYSTQWN